jgi:DNA-binding transcriptional LysR family regulator
MQVSDYALRDLRTFCAVVEHQGFRGAQVVLGMSQPAMSAHLKQLEAALGFRLCTRGRGGFAITKRGEIVYGKCKRLIGALADFEADMGELKRTLTGQLRIGVVDSTITDPRLPMTEVLRRFFQRSQDVDFNLVVETPEALEKDLVLGTLHLAIGPFWNRVKGLNYDPIHDEQHSLYCGRGHPLFETARRDLDLDKLLDHAFVARSYLRPVEFGRLAAANIGATVSNMEAQATLILSGVFLGYLPDHYARKWIDSGQLRRIESPEVDWVSPFYVVTRSKPVPPLIVRVFTEDLKAVLSEALPSKTA